MIALRVMNKLLSSAYLKSALVLMVTVFLFSCAQHSDSGQTQNSADAKKRTAVEQKTVSAEAAANGINSDTLKIADLPAAITYQGKPVKIVGWKDKSGDNILLLTETGEFPSKDVQEYPDNRDAELHVYHYTKSGNSWQEIVSVNDQISSCPVDIVTSFIPGAFFITDLDGNGIAECTFAYRLTCTGGVDNKVMKLIMLENKKKIRDQRNYYSEYGRKDPWNDEV
ncbi:hypothetical protein TH53_13240 [Pedobacter lusitanus]|uniref:Lipoprotein n=1 Tax=Pedobacter lusitanus TaxID=1503925 RepID=A0A0D0GQE9_9SPHI|nr:hypothetical protein [Pedobacter lusitanus]KIO76776.1 hypothetical protein TH53_13240 [Pedobacter lusitanus]